MLSGAVQCCSVKPGSQWAESTGRKMGFRIFSAANHYNLLTPAQMRSVAGGSGRAVLPPQNTRLHGHCSNPAETLKEAMHVENPHLCGVLLRPAASPGSVATPTTAHQSQQQREKTKPTPGLRHEVVSISLRCIEATDRQQPPKGSWQDALPRTNVCLMGSECCLKWLLGTKDITYLNRRPAALPLFSFQQF